MKVSRRFVVKVLGALPLAACGAVADGADGGVITLPVDAGSGTNALRLPRAMLALGSFVAVGDTECTGSSARGAIVGWDSGGVYAFSSTCTHQRGLVTVPNAMGVAQCCLHGAQYDATGRVTKAVVPGQSDLPHLKVQIDGDVLVVKVDEPVERTTRVLL